MITIPKNIQKQILDGDNPQKELEQHLLTNYSITEIIQAFAELMITAEDYVNKPQITVTRQEYEAIMSMYKIKGERFLDGAIVSETRGRPRKIITAPKSEE